MTKIRVSANIMKVLNHPPHAVHKLMQTSLNGLLLALMKNEFQNNKLRQLLLRIKNPTNAIHPSTRPQAGGSNGGNASADAWAFISYGKRHSVDALVAA